MIVTTGSHPSAETVSHALRLAQEWNVPYVERGDDSLARLRERYQTPDLVVVTAKGVRLERKDARPFHFHPNTASFRIKRLERGDTDTMLSVCQIRPGDTVLDATLGLGADSIVFSYAVGPEGKVIGVESSVVVARLVRDGLKSWTEGNPAMVEAMRRVEVVCEDHLSYLRRQPDRSVDVVYFDPMFSVTETSSKGIDGLRSLADYTPIREEAVREALRVARRRIVLKESKASRYYERMGFVPFRKTDHQVIYSYRECMGGE